MINLYAFPAFSDFDSIQKKKISLDSVLKTKTFFKDYDHSEYLLLKQSVLTHDLFLNTLSPDFSGQLLTVHPENAINHKTEIIYFKNSALPKILSIFEQKATEPFLIKSILDFLKHSHDSKYNVISTSTLSWNYGD